MPSFVISTAEAFNGTRFGSRIVQFTSVLNLPLPSIKALQLTKFERKDLWGFRVTQPGRQTEPLTEEILFKMMHDDKEKGLDVVMQELFGRLCIDTPLSSGASTSTRSGDVTSRVSL